jgi:hypothetical protein
MSTALGALAGAERAPLVSSASQCQYQAYWCEENVYQLCANAGASEWCAALQSTRRIPHFSYHPSDSTLPCIHCAERHGLDLDHSFAIFISNSNKTVPFLRQRSSTEPDGQVIWDYHVILLTGNTGDSSDGPLIIDLDTTLPFPCPALRYILETCAPQRQWASRYLHRFRVVPAREYLAAFASDRTHMLRASGKPGYTQTPPSWPPVRGAEAARAMNLPAFWDMSDAAPLLKRNAVSDSAPPPSLACASTNPDESASASALPTDAKNVVSTATASGALTASQHSIFDIRGLIAFVRTVPA